MENRSIRYIPADWLKSAGMLGYEKRREFYIYDGNPTIELIPLASLEPPVRNPDVREFDEARTLRLLSGILCDAPIPPIEVHLKQAAERWSVRNGYHRYWISVAIGFSLIPVIKFQYFEFETT